APVPDAAPPIQASPQGTPPGGFPSQFSPGLPPTAPRPSKPRKRSRVGLIALVVVLLAVVVGGSLTVLGANHQGPLSALFPGGNLSGSGPTSTVAATGTSPQLSPTPSVILPAGTITEFLLPTLGS